MFYKNKNKSKQYKHILAKIPFLSSQPRKSPPFCNFCHVSFIIFLTNNFLKLFMRLNIFIKTQFHCVMWQPSFQSWTPLSTHKGKGSNPNLERENIFFFKNLVREWVNHIHHSVSCASSSLQSPYLPLHHQIPQSSPPQL